MNAVKFLHGKSYRITDHEKLIGEEAVMQKVCQSGIGGCKWNEKET